MMLSGRQQPELFVLGKEKSAMGASNKLRGILGCEAVRTPSESREIKQ
jgi:hypothetical protein